MTTSTSPTYPTYPTSPVPRVGAVRPARRRGVPIVLAVVGLVVTVAGGLAAAAAIGLIAVFGSTGTLDSGQHPVSAAGTALVTDVSHIQNTRGVGPVTGWPSLHVTARGESAGDMFVGVGPADDVDRYLADAATDRVTDLRLHPFVLTTAPHPGAATASRPADQPFWVASSSPSSGSVATLDWQVRDGDYRLVVMNADGTSHVSALARVQLVLPHAFGISVGVLAGSGLVIVVGLGLVVAAALTGRRI